MKKTNKFFTFCRYKYQTLKSIISSFYKNIKRYGEMIFKVFKILFSWNNLSFLLKIIIILATSIGIILTLMLFRIANKINIFNQSSSIITAINERWISKNDDARIIYAISKKHEDINPTDDELRLIRQAYLEFLNMTCPFSSKEDKEKRLESDIPNIESYFPMVSINPFNYSNNVIFEIHKEISQQEIKQDKYFSWLIYSQLINLICTILLFLIEEVPLLKRIFISLKSYPKNN